jgi:hypothetical protein
MAVLVISLMWLAFFIGSLRYYASSGSRLDLVVFPPCIAIFMAQLILHWHRVEIRERGIVTRQGILRWLRIDSYGWDLSRDGFAILKLRVSHPVLFGLIRTRRIRVPVDQKREADAILSKQFAEWPARTNG